MLGSSETTQFQHHLVLGHGSNICLKSDSRQSSISVVSPCHDRFLLQERQSYLIAAAISHDCLSYKGPVNALVVDSGIVGEFAIYVFKHNRKSQVQGFDMGNVDGC